MQMFAIKDSLCNYKTIITFLRFKNRIFKQKNRQKYSVYLFKEYVILTICLIITQVLVTVINVSEWYYVWITWNISMHDKQVLCFSANTAHTLCASLFTKEMNLWNIESKIIGNSFRLYYENILRADFGVLRCEANKNKSRGTQEF